MRPYRLGDDGLDTRLEELIHDAVILDEHKGHEHDEELIAQMLVSGLKMLRDDTERGDLKLVNSALKELRYSFLVFSQYRQIPKVTMYGSARTEPDHPNYELAGEFARTMTEDEGWMVITGAGPGIMEAGNRGAGLERGFGVNIRLPFEADANDYVHESRLINFKYFFTRKLIFVKESDAFVLFPGGFGTQDETFELLTLIQTGKSDLHPVVLMEAEGTGYWERWMDLVTTLESQGMIAPDDRNLFTFTNDPAEAAHHVTRFYDNYHSQRYVDGRLVLRLKHEPTDALLEDLNGEFADIVLSGKIEKVAASEPEIRDDDHVNLFRVRLAFNRRHLGRLRLMVDRLNDAAEQQEQAEQATQ